MHLLVTRPEPDASATAAKLADLGHDVTLAPLLNIELLTPQDRSRPGALALTSRNGVRALAAWPQSAAWRDVPLFAVGPATAGLARDHGFTDVRGAGGDATSLADRIRTDFGAIDGPILWPAGRERAIDLVRLLAGDGIPVDLVEAYRANAATGFDPVVRDLLMRGRIDGVPVYSPRSARILAACLGALEPAPTLKNLVVFGISARAVKPLEGFAVAGIQVADQPDEASLLALIGRAR